jgi:hypothetical protein
MATAGLISKLIWSPIMRERINNCPGMLRGNGYEAECKISATKVFRPGSTTDYELIHRSITHVSKPLPEGRYELTALGQITNLEHRDGQWTQPV